MYFSDIFKDPNVLVQNTKFHISGSDDFLKHYVCRLIAKSHGRRLNYVTSVETYVPDGLFCNSYFYCLSEGLLPRTYVDYTIQLSKRKLPATLKRAGFVEILCNGFFRNQLVDFVRFVARQEQVVLEKSNANYLIEKCGYDPYSLVNCIRLLRFNNSLVETNALPTYQVGDIVEDFMQLRFSAFLSKIANHKKDITEILWFILLRLSKCVTLDLTKKLNWSEQQLAKMAAAIRQRNLGVVISSFQDLVLSREQSFDFIVLKLNLLCFYIIGKEVSL